jgi:hypothetical protein
LFAILRIETFWNDDPDPTFTYSGSETLILRVVLVAGSEAEGEPTEVGEEEDFLEDFSLEDQRSEFLYFFKVMWCWTSGTKISVAEPVQRAEEPKLNCLPELEPKLQIPASAPASAPFYLSNRGCQKSFCKL